MFLILTTWHFTNISFNSKKLRNNLSFCYRGANKQDEALECYGRAANLYKMAKKWSQAGQTFVTVATHHAKLGNKHDSATNYVDAANCYKKSDPKGKHILIQTLTTKATIMYHDLFRRKNRYCILVFLPYATHIIPVMTSTNELIGLACQLRKYLVGLVIFLSSYAVHSTYLQSWKLDMESFI